MKNSKKFTEQREAALAEIKKLADKAEAENRELTVEETSMRDEYAANAGKLFVRAQTAKTEETAAKEAKAAEARNANGTGETATNSTGVGHVRSNEHTYRDGGEFDYMADLGQAALAGVQGMASAASERLRRHAKEMSMDAESARQRLNAGSPREWSKRTVSDEYLIGQCRSGMATYGLTEVQARTGDLSTVAGAGGEFVPPAYLTAQYVPFARAARVFADSVHGAPLPGGTMSLNIPRVTSGTTVASQGTQNTAVSDTALATAYDTIPVVTWAGAQTLSQQLIDRAPIDFSDITFKDLSAALAAQVDIQCLNGSGGSGQVLGALNTPGITTTTWTNASPTYMGFWSQLAKTKAAIASARFLPATHMFVTPNRWEWLESQFDANNRPIIVPQSNGPFNALVSGTDPSVAQGATGYNIQGLKAFQDFNIPANLGGATPQDAVVVVVADDLWLWESPVVARALPQTFGNQLTVLLQVFEYGAFTAARYPVSTGVITGTGLAAPTFAS